MKVFSQTQKLISFVLGVILQFESCETAARLTRRRPLVLSHHFSFSSKIFKEDPSHPSSYVASHMCANECYHPHPISCVASHMCASARNQLQSISHVRKCNECNHPHPIRCVASHMCAMNLISSIASHMCANARNATIPTPSVA